MPGLRTEPGCAARSWLISTPKPCKQRLLEAELEARLVRRVHAGRQVGVGVGHVEGDAGDAAGGQRLEQGGVERGLLLLGGGDARSPGLEGRERRADGRVGARSRSGSWTGRRRTSTATPRCRCPCGPGRGRGRGWRPSRSRPAPVNWTRLSSGGAGEEQARLADAPLLEGQGDGTRPARSSGPCGRGRPGSAGP